MQVNNDGQYEGVINGQTVALPRVTKVIGEFLESWGSVPIEYLEKAARFGTAVHTATEYDDKGELNLVALDKTLWPCVRAWRDYKRDNKIVIEEMETIVYSQKYSYAGRLDRIATVNGRRSVIDIKTAQHKPTHDLQLAAYLNAWNELNPKKKIVKRYTVVLDRDGTYRCIEAKNTNDFSVFLSALALYKWKKNKF